MAQPPDWALTVIYWLHMLATVVWIGGLAALALFVLPAARSSLEAGSYSRLLEGMQRRLDPLGWLCLAVLLFTGLFQMTASPNYSGFLAIESRWALAILLKHIVFAALAATSAYLTWGLLPRLRRLALQRLDQPAGGALQGFQQQEVRLVRLNLILGIVILALTALARVS